MTGQRENQANAVRILVAKKKEPPTLEGSGTLVGPRHILTAFHVVKDATRVVVEWGLPCVSYDAVVVPPDDNGLDVCLLELAEDAGLAANPLQVVARHLPLATKWEAMGYPRGAKAGEALVLQPVDGKAQRAALSDKKIILDVTSSKPNDWHGFSGAGVIVDGRVVGVVRSRQKGWKDGRLNATNASFFKDQEWFTKPLGIESWEDAAGMGSGD